MSFGSLTKTGRASSPLSLCSWIPTRNFPSVKAASCCKGGKAGERTERGGCQNRHFPGQLSCPLGTLPLFNDCSFCWGLGNPRQSKHLPVYHIDKRRLQGFFLWNSGPDMAKQLWLPAQEWALWHSILKWGRAHWAHSSAWACMNA